MYVLEKIIFGPFIFHFFRQTFWLVGRLHQQQHVHRRLQVVQLHWYTTFSPSPTICFLSFMWDRSFFLTPLIFCRPFGCLWLWVFSAEQPGAAVHQLRQWKAAAALCSSLSKGPAGGIRIWGSAVVFHPLSRQSELPGSDWGKSNQHLLPA